MNNPTELPSGRLDHSTCDHPRQGSEGKNAREKCRQEFKEAKA